jgi:RHS repeat-associated protein
MRLLAQAKSMTITGISGLRGTWYDENTGASGYAVDFMVKNTGTQAANIMVTQDCGPWCGANGAWSGLWAYVSPGQTIPVPVSLVLDEWSTATTGVVRLSVVGFLSGGNLSAWDIASALVNFSSGTATLLVPPRPSDVVTTPNGATLALPAGWSSVNFIVTNNADNPYTAAQVTLSLACGGFTGSPAGGSCGRYDSAGNPIYNEQTPQSFGLLHGQPVTVPITLYGPNGARGTVRMIRSMVDPVTNAAVVDTASVFIVAGDQLTPQVTPKGTAVTAAPRYARVDSFTVRNTGTVTATYASTADCGSFASSGCTVSPSGVTIAPNGVARVGVSYTPSATNGATSTIKLVAVGDGGGLVSQRDTGSIIVTALDATAPTITVSPAQNATLTAQSFTATVNVCDDGVIANPVVTFNGVQLPDMFLRAAQAGCVTAGTSTFTLNALPGTNTITVSDADGYHTGAATRTFSYDESVDALPQVAALLAAVKVPPGGPLWTDTFTVRNPGPNAVTYNFSASCGSLAGCAAQPTTALVAAGQTYKAAVAYYPPAGPGISSTIQLTASYTGTSRQVSGSAALTSTTASGALPVISMTPSDGLISSASTITATVTWCDPDDAIGTRQVWLRGVLLPDTFVPQTVAGCASAGTSTWTSLTLVPWDQMLLAQATDAAGHVARVGHVVNYVPSLAAYQPQVTPKNVQMAATRGIVNSQTFQVVNTGSLSATYQLSASCGAFTVCRVDRASLTLAPGARDSAHVSFLVPAAIGSFSPITLVARYVSPTAATVADSGTIIASTPTAIDLYQPKVTALFPMMLVQPGWIPGLVFTITNLGSETTTYALTTTAPSDYLFVPANAPVQSVTLTPGASYSMSVQPRATFVANRTDAVRVVASYTASDGTVVRASDSTLVTTRDGVARLKITTTSARSVTLSRGYGGDVDGAFAVQNIGTYPLSVSLSSVCTEMLVRCSAPLSAFVDTGKTVTVAVTYRVGLSPDAGTFQLTGVSGGPSNSTTSRDSILVHYDGFRAVSIAPDSMWVSVPLGDAGRQYLRIRNDGSAPAMYRYRSTCQNSQGQFFLTTQTCVDSGRTSWIAPGDSAAIPVRYAAAATAGQTGFVRLDAWDVSDDRITTHGRIFLKTATIVPLVVSVKQAGASTTIARNQCLTIKAGDDAAYECGDLRLVHALPTTTTLSRARTPTLVYNSRHHGGVMLFPADVSVTTGGQVSQLIARITIDGQAPETTAFAWNPQWTSRTTMRIVVPFHARERNLATGAYHYVLAVDAVTDGAPLSNQDEDTVAVVNRSSSEFGPGWWLDGYERLVFPALPNRVLWVGGDGSTRLYKQKGSSNVWLVDPAMDRPDTLIASNGWWYRRARNGAYVMFDATGLHAATVDSRQRVTWFNHEDAQHPTWLTSITLPVPIGSAAVRRYVMGHDAASPFVSWIDAPGSVPRHVSLSYGLAPDGSTVVSRISDPDTVHGVSFGYLAAGRLQSRLDRRGYTTTFAFDDKSLGLIATTLDVAGTAASNVSLSFCGAETASLSSCARGPIDSASVVTRFDGPRLASDAIDTASFHVTRYGAPSRIADAAGNVTHIERGDTRWPALTTKTIDPTGFTTTATYDAARALIVSTTSISPRSLVGGIAADSSATTIYTWDGKWDVVTQVLTPAKTLTQYVYDPASGDLLSQHMGTGTSRNVSYGYDAATRLVNAVTTLTSATPTRYHYDPLGNVDTTTTPRGLRSSVLHDFLGRDSVIRTPIEDLPTVNWRQQTYTFDVNGRLRIVTDSGQSTAPNSTMKLTVLSDYDAEGNVVSVTRRVWPDSLNLGDLVLVSAYDAANRKTSETDPFRGTIRSWSYDPAGNATVTVRGQDTVTAQYDALNRVTHRVVFGAPNNPYTPEAASDDQRFYYNARSELVRATNRNAEVRRVYNRAGAIAYDTSIVFAAPLSSPSVNQHVYGLAYTYDLDGRRATFTPPMGLSVVSPVSYGYDAITGDLKTLSVQNGGTFRYTYTPAGLLDSLIEADATVERHFHDDDGRETRRTEFSVVRQQMLHDETVGLDGRGRRTAVASAGLAWAPLEQYTYDGLDGVLSATGRTVESTPRDPLGNARLRVNSTEQWAEQYQYEPHSTRMHYLARQLSENLRIDSVSQTYNLAGDVVRVLDQVTGPALCQDGQSHYIDCPPGDRRLIAQSLLQNSYDADGRLLLSVKQTTNDQSALWPAIGVRDPNWTEVYSPFERGVTEEYRYDPLGRRVWVRAHRDPYCPTQRDRDSTTLCLGTIERTVYDGDQVIAEIRQPGDDNALASTRESDGVPGGVLGAHFGQVGYVHGLGIDRPLALWRNYTGNVTKLVTHYQWQGALELGTTLSGQLIQCALPGAISPCEDIDWPGAKIRFGIVWPHPSLGPPSWWGTMAGMRENATGMRDMRNRQYDPKTGRFTQEDPIGLAGGMNLYGFAAGDPVNYSDPFGLCLPRDKNNSDCPWMHEKGLEGPGLLDPVALLSGGISAGIELGLAQLFTKATVDAGARVVANKIAGDAFRDEIASAFESNGYGVAKEVGKKTPFGRRVIDVEVSRKGEVLGGVEAKAGKSRYLPWQMAKDEYLRRTGYTVQVVRDATVVRVSGIPPQ